VRMVGGISKKECKGKIIKSLKRTSGWGHEPKESKREANAVGRDSQRRKSASKKDESEKKDHWRGVWKIRTNQQQSRGRRT